MAIPGDVCTFGFLFSCGQAKSAIKGRNNQPLPSLFMINHIFLCYPLLPLCWRRSCDDDISVPDPNRPFVSDGHWPTCAYKDHLQSAQVESAPLSTSTSHNSVSPRRGDTRPPSPARRCSCSSDEWSRLQMLTHAKRVRDRERDTHSWTGGVSDGPEKNIRMHLLFLLLLLLSLDTRV